MRAKSLEKFEIIEMCDWQGGCWSTQTTQSRQPLAGSNGMSGVFFAFINVFQRQEPIYLDAAGLIAAQPESLAFQQLRDTLILGVGFGLKAGVFLGVFRGHAARANGWQVFAFAIGINTNMTITGHTMRSVIVEIFAMCIRSKQIPDCPASLNYLAAPALRDVLRRKADVPVREIIIEQGFDFVHENAFLK